MNLFDPPPPLAAERFESLLTAPGCRIERIVSHGHVSAPDFWYDQPEDEWVAVLQGAARLRFEDEAIELRAGDWLHIPARRRHRVEWTAPDEPTIWLAVFFSERITHDD